jgi:FkbM family methyltransferase
MFQLISKKIKFIIKSTAYYFPFLSPVLNKLMLLYLKLEYFLVFRKKSFIFYNLNKNIKIKLNKNSFLAKLVLNDFEYEELVFIEQLLLKDDVVFDVGANIGIYSLLCADYVGENGKVFAFEPVSATVKLLQENIKLNKLNNIVVCEKAVSSVSNERLKIYTNKDGFDAFDSVLKPFLISSEDIIIESVTLDDFIVQQNINISKIRLIKIDVEGWEFSVLQGAKKIIEMELPVSFLVEFNKEDTVKNELVFGFMQSYNYTWHTFDVPIKKLTRFTHKINIFNGNLIAVNDNFKQLYPNFF